MLSKQAALRGKPPSDPFCVHCVMFSDSWCYLVHVFMHSILFFATVNVEIALCHATVEFCCKMVGSSFSTLAL